ncbi:elongation factor P 5-aminopentanone reductase [Sutcliffiella rhizosphaerae]|uniref:3-oxoacyl-[acyl-carrier-protein] reductase FabG n=1 Tax=Sutcliffiella rhizosphaerae TaxID=2880967 RepID=A0ABN8A3S8_9BACI|nr:SDR family oxidoreductase [Sutcliffiella rhizosphaerae]CAG9619649.1 3-oxoacyl-[acyl-carrier-protein] reductase FabG [Sutcliffiella rhizosphaerae]
MVKKALVVGASGDIGTAIANELLNQGYFTYLHYNKDKKSIDGLLEKYGMEQITSIQADLSCDEGVNILKRSIYTQIDTIIYNAGYTYYGVMTDIDDKTKQDMIQLNITSLYSTVQSFLPEMIRNHNGNVIVISSIWGEVGASCEVLYSMTKGAQISFVKALAKEVALSGIRVNAITPGAVATKMLYNFSEEEKMDLCKEIPIGRLADPHEVADAVGYLISGKSTYITGQVLGVNGGWN